MRDNLILLIQHIDNQRGLFEHIMTNLENAVTYNGSPSARTDKAADIVYRAVCQELGILPVGSDEWLGAGDMHDDFKNALLRELISSPDDDVSGEWRGIGAHYLAKLEEYRHHSAQS